MQPPIVTFGYDGSELRERPRGNSWPLSSATVIPAGTVTSVFSELRYTFCLGERVFNMCVPCRKEAATIDRPDPIAEYGVDEDWTTGGEFRTNLLASHIALV